MTNTPGDESSPQEPGSHENQPHDEPGYWEQQAGSGQTAPYSQQPYPAAPPPGQAPGYPQGYPPQGQVQYAPDHPKATTSLVLGILGLVVCGVIAPFAWSMGKKTVAEIDASNGALGGRGAAQAGYVMGIIGTILLALGLVILVVYLIAMIVFFGTSSV